MSDLNLEQKARTIADLALQGQGCALQQEIQSLSKDATQAVWPLAQARVDEEVARNKHFPYVEFINVDRRDFIFHGAVNYIDPGRETMKTRITDEYKGYLFGGTNNCLDLRLDSKKEP